MIKTIISSFSDPKIFLITIFWLMILVILGTLSQADIGLYSAQEKYFSSWITWLGIMPTPGGRLALFIMFLNLFSFVLKRSFWSIKKIGIIITHLGVLLLLLGGGVTAWFSSEGVMIIEEGGFSNFIADSHKKELVIIDTGNSKYDKVISISDNFFRKGKVIENSKIPFTIEIIDYFINCSITPRSEPDYRHKGFSKNFVLSEIPPEKERERNTTGITFRISNASQSVDGIYSLVIDQRIPQIIPLKGKELTLTLRRERVYLPFNLELIDFKKELYPGTGIARSFSSKINIHEIKNVKIGDISRSVIIKMNHPLRYKNYTFYQSSFIDDFDTEATVLSVVKNYGRLFPYIASIIMSFGLLLHMILKLPKLFSRKKGGARL